MAERSKGGALLAPAAKIVALVLVRPALKVPLVGGQSLAELVVHGLARFLANGPLRGAIDDLLWEVYRLLVVDWFGAIVGILFGGLLGLGLRIVARSRVRAGHADPLDRVRRFVDARPRVVAALTALPALLFSAGLAATAHHLFTYYDTEVALAMFALPLGVSFVVNIGLARRGLRALVAPTLDGIGARAEGTELDAEGFAFDAVALTPQTFGAVTAMALLTLLMVTLVAVLPIVVLYRNTGFHALVLAYIAGAFGSAYLFQRRSRIAIGLDGVLVGGTTKERFVAYRDVDHARARGDVIELRTSTQAVLRLQLHGEDAGRRAAIVARLNDAIARAKAHRADPAAGFVEAASVDELTRAAQGAASYRMATPTRDKLWEIFESPALAAEARRTAAEALLPGIDDEERARFRVAAERIAEPKTRVHLAELLDEEAPAPVKLRRAAPPAGG